MIFDFDMGFCGSRVMMKNGIFMGGNKCGFVDKLELRKIEDGGE